jgi:pimeloyl-ACP methyl ester carboxylesterase
VWKYIPICLAPLLTGCLATGYRSEAYRAPLPPAQCTAGVVFVANGSGDFQTVSQNLTEVVAEAALPLQVDTFVWSHGYLRYLYDHVDHDGHLSQGRLLAARVAEYRQAYPMRRIHLIGHSAGSAVVLAAAEMLPPGSVDRVILLAPSVSREYDLRPALRTSRCGIDVFHSDRDRFILGLCMQIVGTADHGSRTAAGRWGFTPVICDPADTVLYSKLRQHPWDPAIEWTGNGGGHYGTNKPEFLRAYVLPLLVE